MSNPTANLYFDGLVLQFLASAADARDALSPLAPGRPEDARIARVIDYVEAHLGGALNIADLAGVACLSPSHFSRAFKATTGEAVWTYVLGRRCERARELLATTDRPIAQVAHDCGFANQAHLGRAFKARFGATPGALRR